MYGGFGSSRWSGQGSSGWHDSPISYGELGRIQLELPDGGQRSVPAVRLDPFGAAVWLSDTPTGSNLSPSLAWFAALTSFAVRLVGSRRVAPEVLEEGPFTVARWRPVLNPSHHDALAHAAASAPAICRNGTRSTTEQILSALVDWAPAPRERAAVGRPAGGRRFATRAGERYALGAMNLFLPGSGELPIEEEVEADPRFGTGFDVDVTAPPGAPPTTDFGSGAGKDDGPGDHEATPPPTPPADEPAPVQAAPDEPAPVEPPPTPVFEADAEPAVYEPAEPDAPPTEEP